MTELKRRHESIDLGTPFCAASVKRHKADGSISARERKEKIGEKVAALQQLVSPFGKTDTASVLLEATGYIKFLQDQVQVLSAPYLQSRTSGKLQVAPNSDLNTLFKSLTAGSVCLTEFVNCHAGSNLLQPQEQGPVPGASRMDAQIRPKQRCRHMGAFDEKQHF